RVASAASARHLLLAAALVTSARYRFVAQAMTVDDVRVSVSIGQVQRAKPTVACRATVANDLATPPAVSGVRVDVQDWDMAERAGARLAQIRKQDQSHRQRRRQCRGVPARCPV